MKIPRFLLGWTVLWLVGLQVPLYAAETFEADVCVYGGTSGGVSAAVQAARMGKKVVLVEPGAHLGGMTSGGLSAVDIGEPRSVGGIAREYFTRLVASYGKQLNWGEAFKSHGGGPATGGAYSIEPHVAEQLFDQMAEEAGVVVLRNAEIAKAKKDGARITELEMADGRTVKARMFLDTTYEGDLMAAAGVTYTVMREGNAKYGETYNGIYYSPKYEPRTGHLMPGENGRVKGGQGAWDRDFPLDPYVVKGDPSSGLLPLVNEGEPGVPGEPAPGVQAYCYRLCMTTDPENMIPITEPEGYDPKRYELVVRFIEACQENGDEMDLGWFSKHDPLPNDKWDFNTATFGGNLPGASWAWPEAGYDQRREIATHIENYHRGLLHFLATDPRVPETVRKDAQRFGLPKDEFQDTGGWPHQIYVREGRRMVSDFVMTEHHTFGREIAEDSVGLGSYGTDCHEIRRIVKDGVVTREGKVAMGRGGFGPYQISYRALVPKAEECENLYVTFALSASHTAFASIRMEPVLMVTSQSAATAACYAIDEDLPVQEVDYDQIRERLLADGQILSWDIQTTESRPVNRKEKLAGIVMDDSDGEYVGHWVTSGKQASVLGIHYSHDNQQERGKKVARFTPDIPEAGDYEVRVLYSWHPNRSTKTQVMVASADGEQSFRINQREPSLVKRIPVALGVFSFEAGKQGKVEISNRDANGYVVVDGVQFVPADIAKAEREGNRDSGYVQISMVEEPSKSKHATAHPLAGKVAVSPLAETTLPNQDRQTSDEPVLLAKAAAAKDVDGKEYDLVIIGGTGGGVAMAVRAAREGCSVLVVQHNGHIGGMMTNGLMQWDALYGGPRSPIFTEILGNIEQHYIQATGRDSKDHQIIRCTHEHYPISWAEPHVAEREYNRLVAGEDNITLLLDHYPTQLVREGSLIKSTTLMDRHTKKTIEVAATTFADATYEGDLFALADVPYHCGREARDAYGEPHAGKVFTNIAGGPPLSLLEEGTNIRAYTSHQGTVDPDSPFTEDDAVQAYNYRFCVTRDPANRLPIPKPAGYNRDEYVNYHRKYIASHGGPNLKSHVNSPILPGENHAYPEASWEEREAIIQRHLDFGLGLMWFLQNDESVPESKQKEYREWGLPKDEYADNNHVPYEMYVREARRIVGRHVFTELDGSLAKDYARTPVMPDSIAITDWYMDSHSCTMDHSEGYKYDGKLILTNESRPSQIPYRAMLPQGVDNLLVPIGLGSTHISWGAIRLEPVFLQTGEAAGFAAALAKQQGVTPAELDPDLLLRTLVERRMLVSFFNEIKVDADDPRIPAAQYFGAKGFFGDYFADLNAPLSEPVRALWDQGFQDLQNGTLDARKLAASIYDAEQKNPPATGEQRGAYLLKLWNQLD